MHRSGAYRWVLVRGLAVRSVGKQAHRLAGSLTDITARKTTEERLLHDAMHDVLTGLPNRAYFLDQLRRSIQRLKRHSDYWNAVLFIDLDRFKLVNESFGHAAGDQLLIETARRLETSLRPQDTVARFGGDEFAILLDDIKLEEDAIRVADRVQTTMSQPFYLQNQEVFTSASIGIVVNIGNYERAEDLLRDSDTALYEAKANGRNRHQTFDANMRMRNLALLQLETDLRRALERQEFEVYYMPIVSLPSGTIASLEALVRWHHPERGMILPNDFIPHAEENGLIVPINDWVIRTACNQLKQWLPKPPSLRVSVNLSARQLQNPNLPEQFRQIITEAGIDPRALQLELTESAAMQDFDLTIRILTELSDMGIMISLDDFGMRYSSLDYLKRFPVNTIKIDKSFIWDIPEDGEDAAITRTIISVGHLLNKIVVAEGVESPRQLDFLHQHQCDAVQGFLYSEPLNTAAITIMLNNGLVLTPLVPDFPNDETE
jgi:diguanylate cyclase (GGDEF)-like protein